MGPDGVAFRGFIGPKRFRKEKSLYAPIGALGGAWEGRSGRLSTLAKPLVLLAFLKRLGGLIPVAKPIDCQSRKKKVAAEKAGKARPGIIRPLAGFAKGNIATDWINLRCNPTLKEVLRDLNQGGMSAFHVPRHFAPLSTVGEGGE